MTAQAKPYAVRIVKIDHVTYWRGRRRVHWSKERITSRHEELEAAKRSARQLVQRQGGLAVVWVTFKSRRAWTTDGQYEITEKT